MKYFTKEWYRTLQRTNLHLLLKPSERAAVFSEEYFQELYAQHVQEHLEWIKRVSEVDLDDLEARLFGSNTPSRRLDGKPLTEQEKQAASGFSEGLSKSLREAPQIQFDPDKEKQVAHEHYLAGLHRFERNLPSEIQNKVADMRVLALYHATQDTIDEIKAFCNTNQITVEDASAAYRREFRRNFSGGKPAFLQDFQWHDDKILAMHRENGDIRLDFDWGASCRFVGAEFIECDEALENACWLYDEIYPLECGGYEIHALLHKAHESGMKLVDFIIRCRDVEIRSND